MLDHQSRSGEPDDQTMSKIILFKKIIKNYLLKCYQYDMMYVGNRADTLL